MTLPVYFMDKTRANIVVKPETAFGSTNEERAENAWADRLVSEPTSFAVTLPDGQGCYLGTCHEMYRTAFTSASRIWYTEGAVSR
jgi:hypothetical protein